MMAEELKQLTTGKYLFFGAAQHLEGQNIMVVQFSASALAIQPDQSRLSASIQHYEIGPLLSKRSTHLKEDQSLEAHKLYTWPANLGDPQAWANSKRQFFETHLISHPIEILNVMDEQQIVWKFIPESEFRSSVEEAQALNLLLSISNNL